MNCPICNAFNEDSAEVCAACGAPLAEVDVASNLLAPGTALQGGAFSVGRMLGQGGFGITYLGSDTRLNRLIAVKEFFPAGCARKGHAVAPAGGWTPAAYAEARERFLQEAQTLARFKHPGIVDVFAAFDENNTVYMVMELLEGKSLTDLLKERGGRLEEAQAVDFIAQVGAALEEVHRAGLLHRDIKPENVMVAHNTPDTNTFGGSARRVVLIDFGTAKEFAAGRTQGTSVVVTPGYAPLEQYAQRAARGPYTDVYALAATLYHLLTGEAPTSATDRATGVEIADVRRLNSGVSLPVAAAVMCALAMEAARRPQTVRAFLQMLKGGYALQTNGSSGPPAPQNSSLSGLATRFAASRAGTLTAPLAVPAPITPGVQTGFGASAPLLLNGHKGSVTSVAFSPYGDVVASGSWDGTVRLWDAAAGRLRKTLDAQEHKVTSVAFSPDGELLAGGLQNGAVLVWDVASGRLLRTLKGYLDAVTCLDFSSDGTTLASGRGRGTVHLWNAASGTFLRPLKVQHSGAINAVAFAPDGKTLAGACWEVVRLWEAPGGEHVGTLRVHGGRLVNAVAFSPDGQTLASGGDDKMVRLWDVRTKTVKQSLSGHGARVQLYSWVHAVAFSPDGNVLATGGCDTTIKLWDVAGGEVLETLQGHGDWVLSIAFSPDGQTLASAGEDRIIRLWRNT